MISEQQKYQFVKVEEFFSDHKKWHSISKIEKTSDIRLDGLTISLFLVSDIATHKMLIEFIKADVFRVRFDPGVVKLSKTSKNRRTYSKDNSRSIAIESFEKLRKSKNLCTAIEGTLESFRDFSLKTARTKKTVEITSIFENTPVIKLKIDLDPFMITVFGIDEQGEFKIVSTSKAGLHFTENGFDNNYSIIQSMDKNPDAKFVGFGEQGGIELCKNTSQLTYFNYDNMRYSQMYNRGPLESREPLYHSDPFFMELYGVPAKQSAYGIFIDNTSEVCMDIGYLNSSKYMFGTRYGSLDYYFIYGQNCKDIITSFTSIVGRPRLKPRYALGYHQGCYGYDTREKVENCAKAYAESNIPLDGIHIDVDIQDHHKTFTIDLNKFPNPKEMFSNLRKQGIKCSTNITPIIRNDDYKSYNEGIENEYFVADERSDSFDDDARKYYWYESGNVKEGCADGNFNSGRPYIGGINYGYGQYFTGHYPDLGRLSVRKWWGEQYQYLFDMGLEMVWQDMTTPAIAAGLGDLKSFPARLLITNDSVRKFDDEAKESQFEKEPFIKIWNLYSYNLHKATYHGLNRLEGRENKRNFIIGRGSFTGAHRFAALWTGDNASTWDFLKINISQCLALGLTGQAISGQDIGGFEKGSDYEQWADPELLMRWTMVGAFLPWFRNHYTGKEGAKLFQEPYRYAEKRDVVPDEYKFLYDAVLPTCRFYIQLRYRLLQLFYDKMFENTLNGMPICRPMFLTDMDYSLYNDKINFLNNQFLVGDDLLVAPILEKSCNNRDVYLPAGSNWYAFKDNKKALDSPIEGGTTVDYYAPISSDINQIPFSLPLYVRSGAVIPTILLEKYVGQLNAEGIENPITINIYPEHNIEPRIYNMYLDDGVSRSSAAIDDISGDEAAADEYRKTVILHHYSSKDRNIRFVSIIREHDNYTPVEKYFFVAILHDDEKILKSVKINNKEIKLFSEGTVESRKEDCSSYHDNAWYHNESTSISIIKVFDNSSSLKLKLQY